MSGKKRLAIFLSILWLVAALMFGIGIKGSLIVFVLGVSPLLLIWGVWWVIQGFNGDKQNKLP